MDNGIVMENKYFNDSDFLTGLLDIVPSLVLIVDNDVNILNANDTTVDFLQVPKEYILNKRSGEVMHCIHSHDSPLGCGRGPDCSKCIIRNSVNEAMQGKKITRKQTTFIYRKDEKTLSVHLLVTAAPFAYQNKQMVLLLMEDISELVSLRKIIPICASCKKVRQDKGYWEDVEVYLKSLIDVDFSHGICPDCMKKLYPEYNE